MENRLYIVAVYIPKAYRRSLVQLNATCSDDEIFPFIF